jgi:hypothetical protein
LASIEFHTVIQGEFARARLNYLQRTLIDAIDPFGEIRIFQPPAVKGVVPLRVTTYLKEGRKMVKRNTPPLSLSAGRCWVKIHRRPHPVGHQRIQTGLFIAHWNYALK